MNNVSDATTQRLALRAAVVGVAGAFAGAIPVGRLHGRKRAAYVLVPAAVATAAGWVILKDDNLLSAVVDDSDANSDVSSGVSKESQPHSESEAQLTGVSRAAIATAVGLVFGTSQLVNTWLDRVCEDALVRRGVQRPRMVLALGNAVLGAAAVVIDSTSTRSGSTPDAA